MPIPVGGVVIKPTLTVNDKLKPTGGGITISIPIGKRVIIK